MRHGGTIDCQMSEVRTAIPSAVSSAARPPERTHSCCRCSSLHLSAHRPTCPRPAGWSGGRRAMMLVGLAEHNQPQRESEPDLGPSITSLAANKLLPPARRSTACPSVVCCLPLPTTTLSRRRSTTTTTSAPPRQAHRLPPSHPLSAQQQPTRVSQPKSRAR